MVDFRVLYGDAWVVAMLRNLSPVMVLVLPVEDVAVALRTPPLAVRSRRSSRTTSASPKTLAMEEPTVVCFQLALGLLARRLHGSETPRRYGSGAPPCQTSSLFSVRPPDDE